MLIKQGFIILSMLFLGTVITKLFHLPIPSNVLGFAILFAALCGKVIKLHQVERLSDIITDNLALFFVVPIAGVIVHLELIKDQFADIFLPLAVSIIFGFFAAAKVTELLIRREEKKLAAGERSKAGDRDDQ